MGRYRKKPVVIEAVQFTVDTLDDLLGWMAESGYWLEGTRLKIPTLEGVMEATLGDWIIKGIQGEFYPCKPDIFEATYEEVRDG